MYMPMRMAMMSATRFSAFMSDSSQEFGHEVEKRERAERQSKEPKIRHASLHRAEAVALSRAPLPTAARVLQSGTASQARHPAGTPPPCLLRAVKRRTQ